MGDFLRWILGLITPLLNERGQAGEDDDDLEPGDPGLDEDEPGELDDDDLEPELDDEDEDEEDDEDDLDDLDSEKDKGVPQERFDKVYGKAKAAERKLDEFKRLGPDAYYKLYPDEKPDDLDTDDEDDEEGLDLSDQDAGALIVRGGKYNGMTLREVYAEDPAEATFLHNQYLASQRDEAVRAKADQERLRQESENEVRSFDSTLAADAFGKELDDLEKEELKQVIAVRDEVLDFMEKTGRGGGIIADAFFLMNKDNLLNAAANKGVKSLLESLKNSDGVTSISSNKTTGKAKGYAAYTNMSREAIADKLEEMTEEQQDSFLAKAPAEFKKKFPDLPYPD